MIWKLNFTKICLYAILLFPIGFGLNFIAWTVSLPLSLNTIALVLGFLFMYLSPIILIISLVLGFIKTNLNNNGRK